MRMWFSQGVAVEDKITLSDFFIREAKKAQAANISVLKMPHSCK